MKWIRKILLGIAAIILCIAGIPGIEVQAGTGGDRLYLDGTQYMVGDTNQKIYDYANLLSDEEEEKLQEMAADMAGRYQADFLFVLIDENPAPGTSEIDSTQDFADLFFDENYFGTQSGGTGYNEGNGACFVIDMANRQYALSTTGFVHHDYFGDEEVDGFLDAVEGDVKDGNYSGAGQRAFTYIDHVLTYGSEAAWKRHEYEQMSFGEKVRSAISRVDFLLPLLVGGFAALFAAIILIAGHKKTRTASGAGAYAVPDSLKIRRKNEYFVNTFTRVEDISNDDKGGGGGSHTSSGGGSHGGGSRGF